MYFVHGGKLQQARISKYISYRLYISICQSPSFTAAKVPWNVNHTGRHTTHCATILANQSQEISSSRLVFSSNPSIHNPPVVIYPTVKLASLRRSKMMPTDGATAKFLYTILKQLDHKSVMYLMPSHSPHD